MRTAPSYRGPNLVIATRVALAFVAIALLSTSSPVAAAAGVALIVIGLAMDGLDGFVARREGATSDLGAVLDITADRIVELVFWVFFAVAHQVGVWAPLIVVTRSLLVDTARSLALTHGKTAFGHSTMMRPGITRFLTSSRFMRTLYGTSKTVAFVLMGCLMVVDAAAAGGGGPLSPGWVAGLQVGSLIAVLLAVVLCVARGLPVLWDSRRYLTAPTAPPGVGSAT